MIRQNIRKVGNVSTTDVKFKPDPSAYFSVAPLDSKTRQNNNFANATTLTNSKFH